MKKVLFLCLLCFFIPLLASCRSIAINAISNALTGTGNADVFTSDPDPELVGAAIPFAIKMYETLLAQNPSHQGLLLTTGSLFVMYANAFVQQPAMLLDPIDYFHERRAAFDRAKALYLRGNSILSSAIEMRFPGFSGARADDGSLNAILSRMRQADVPLLFWTAASGFAALSIDLFDFDLAASIPAWSAMMSRAYELYPDFNSGAINEFFILFYASLPPHMGGDRALAETHFQRALERTGGSAAGPFVSYATAISVPDQDFYTFRDKLETALAIDVDAEPSIRLLNVLAQRRARSLLDHAYRYFSFLPFGGWEDDF
ncbi:MAG: TRAP transporter TatT component family protein [Treponema sp.]|jgi:predicted anti-sigma-YlaC factor YlaD|nr:TRAP transporter TatT component family protein [Treponema sp.]